MHPRRFHAPATALALAALCLAASGTPRTDTAEAAPSGPVPAVELVNLTGVRAPEPPVRPVTLTLSRPREGGGAVVVAARAPGGDNGIPVNVLAAYRAAAERVGARLPGCHLAWHHLAGIGVIESGHARGGRATPAGDTAPRILGPRLDGGPGIAAIADTDGGRFDADAVWDRAVGPMQFIPSTWAAYGTDADGDGEADPHNLADATTAAGLYLCSGGLDLAEPGDLRAAIFRYNNSAEYVAAVMSWMHTYSGGATPVPPSPAGPDETPVTLTAATKEVAKPARPVQTPAPVPSPSPEPEEQPAPEQPTTEEPEAPAGEPAEDDGVELELPCGSLEQVAEHLDHLDDVVITESCTEDEDTEGAGESGNEG